MEVAIPITNELEQRISDAFCIFDHHGDKRIDIREVGTVLRFLGCVPTEQDVNEVIAATEMEESAGDVHLSKFMPHVAQLIAERKMEPASPEKILAAFQVLDPEQKTYITKEYMSKVMMEEGEPFTQEELDEMLAVAIDPITGNIPYVFYINQLMHAPKDSIYKVAETCFILKSKEGKRGSKWTASQANKHAGTYRGFSCFKPGRNITVVTGRSDQCHIEPKTVTEQDDKFICEAMKQDCGQRN